MGAVIGIIVAMTLAARYRESFQGNLLAIASAAVNTGATTPPFAWVVPPDQRDMGAAVALLRILHDSGIEVQKAAVVCPEGTRPEASVMVPEIASGTEMPVSSNSVSAA